MKFKVNYYYIVNKNGERKMSVNIETQNYIKQKEMERQRQNQNNNNDFVTYAIAAIIVFFIYAILFN